MNETAESFAEMVDILIRTPAQAPSIHINVPLRKEWDTSTLMIHMGRDHGLQGYVQYAHLCYNISTNVEKIKFEDLYQFGISRKSSDILKELYRLEIIFLLKVIGKIIIEYFSFQLA